MFSIHGNHDDPQGAGQVRQVPLDRLQRGAQYLPRFRMALSAPLIYSLYQA